MKSTWFFTVVSVSWNVSGSFGWIFRGLGVVMCYVKWTPHRQHSTVVNGSTLWWRRIWGLWFMFGVYSICAIWTVKKIYILKKCECLQTLFFQALIYNRFFFQLHNQKTRNLISLVTNFPTAFHAIFSSMFTLSVEC